MDIGVITARSADYHPNDRLLEAAGKRGASLGLINPYRVASVIMDGVLQVIGMENTGPPRVILPRQGAQIGESSMSLLRHFVAMGIPMVNGLSAVALARNKFSTLQALSQYKIPFPDAVFVNSAKMLYQGAERLGGFPVVAKKPSGRQGGEVFLLTGDADAERVLAVHLEAGAGLILQRFIPPGGRRDLRVLVMGGNVVAAMELEPKTGDFRSNFHVSGESRPVELSRETGEIAVRSAGALGLDIAGVDIIVDAHGAPWVIEVNFSPGFRGLEAATGMDIAAEMVDFAIAYIG